MDSQGHAYPPVGMALPSAEGFALGDMSSLVQMFNLDPPALDIEFTIVRSGMWGLETIEGNTLANAPSGAWPVVQRSFIVPEDAGGFVLGGPVPEIAVESP